MSLIASTFFALALQTPTATPQPADLPPWQPTASPPAAQPPAQPPAQTYEQPPAQTYPPQGCPPQGYPPQGQPPPGYYPFPPPYTDLPTTATKPAEATPPESVTHRKLVVSQLFGLSFGVLFPVPSGDFSLFVGSNLRPRKSLDRTREWNTALGYQLTLSVGLAEWSPQFVAPPAYDNGGIFHHRHHLMAMGHGGKRGRLFYALGGGVWMWLSRLMGVEAEGRIGYVFSAPEGRRVKGVVGGTARLTGTLEGIPLPMFGVFIGYMVF